MKGGGGPVYCWGLFGYLGRLKNLEGVRDLRGGEFSCKKSDEAHLLVQD